MDWDDLQYFLAAYRQRSLAGAARELRCESTTVGRRLAALESALELRLFMRTPDGLVPTDAATDLAPAAEEAERAVHSFERRAAGHGERIAGVVRISTSEAFGTYLIPRLVELRERHPELIVEVLADNRVLDVSRGEADLALRFVATPQRDLIVRKVGDVNWAMYASEAYLARRGAPSPIGDLAGHEVVAFDETLATAPGATWLAEHGDGATVVFRGNNLRSVLEATRAGMGLTVLPCQLCDPEAELRRVSPEVLGSRGLHVVVHPDLSKVPRIRAVIDFLVEVARRDRVFLAGG